jgi:hypothetical protein
MSSRARTMTHTVSSLWPIPRRCYNHYSMGGLSLGGSGVRTTRSLPRLSTGNQQAQINHSLSSRRLADTRASPFECSTRLHCGHSPSCLNRAVVPPGMGRDTRRRTLTPPLCLRYWHLSQSSLGTWGLPLSRRACKPLLQAP